VTKAEAKSHLPGAELLAHVLAIEIAVLGAQVAFAVFGENPNIAHFALKRNNQIVEVLAFKNSHTHLLAQFAVGELLKGLIANSRGPADDRRVTERT